MTYDERIQIAVEMLKAFLSRYTPPKHLDNHGKAQIVRGMAEALARKLPISEPEMYRENVGRAFAATADGHESYAWPPQGVLVKAIGKINPSQQGRAAETFTTNFLEIEAKRMARGDAVSERFVWGNYAMSAEVTVSPEQLEKYRKASVENHRSIYGAEAQAMMAEKYGAAVHQYFPMRAAE